MSTDTGVKAPRTACVICLGEIAQLERAKHSERRGGWVCVKCQREGRDR